MQCKLQSDACPLMSMSLNHKPGSRRYRMQHDVPWQCQPVCGLTDSPFKLFEGLKELVLSLQPSHVLSCEAATLPTN